jgi:cholest-4-en-3-one 26-monooxygenase
MFHRTELIWGIVTIKEIAMRTLFTTDLADASTYADGTPHDLFKQLRRDQPVYWNARSDGGPGIWCITRHADIAEIGRDPQRFTSTRGVNITRLTPEEEERSSSTLLIFMDPPRHTRLRGVIAAAFSPRRIAELESQVRRNAVTALNKVLEKGECDLFDLAAELPIRMICDLLGIPEQDHLRVLDWTNRTFGHEDPDYSTGHEDQMRAYQEMFQYAAQMIESRRKHPTDDVMSAIANAQIDGEPLAVMELNYLFFLLAGAGNDTTRTLILNASKLFAEHPDAWVQMRADRSLVANAVEEVLRMEPSVRGMGRMVVHDTVVGGTQLKAGDHLYMWYVSANRDEALFEDSNRFDIRRPNANRHQAFGGGGPHFCIGAPLARLQARILIDLMLDSIPEFGLAGKPAYARSIQFNTLKRLPIRFRPTAPIAL